MHLKRTILAILSGSIFALCLFPQEDLKIEAWTVPSVIGLGEEGVLKIRVTPHSGVRISSHPEFMIRFSESEQFSFSKIFFTASELNFSRIQEGEAVFLDLQKEVEIPFRVNESAYLGRHTIRGEIIFTILSPDNWYIKTVQKFQAVFSTKKSSPADKRNNPIRKKIGLTPAFRLYNNPSLRYHWMVSAKAASRS